MKESRINNSWILEKPIAHRGFFDEVSPENSLSAFQKALEKGYAIECDLHLIQDGTVVVIHDDTTARTTSQDKYVSSLTKEDLKEIKLNGSEEHIPTLHEVLALVDGKTPILFEIKNNGKVGELESAVWNVLKDYKGEFAIESFNPYVLKWFKDNAPNVIRGQLGSKLKGIKFPFFKKIALKKMLLNKITEPDFIAYNLEDLPYAPASKCGLPLVSWTIRSQEEYLKAIQISDNVIFESFEPKI